MANEIGLILNKHNRNVNMRLKLLTQHSNSLEKETIVGDSPVV